MGPQGWRGARELTPDLIILDLMLPWGRRRGGVPNPALRVGRADHHADGQGSPHGACDRTG